MIENGSPLWAAVFRAILPKPYKWRFFRPFLVGFALNLRPNCVLFAFRFHFICISSIILVYQTKFRDEGQPLLNGVLLPQGAQPLVEPLADRLILLPKAESVMGIGCHTLHAEQQCGAQRHDVRIAAP